MKVVMISEKELDRLFGVAMHQYQYNHKFMHGHEDREAFEKTKRYQMLQLFKATMEKLKNDVKNHPLGE